jgi:hypothetical protein
MVTLVSPIKPVPEGRTWKLKQSGPIAMLAAGVLTFVMSSSLALALHMLPDRQGPDSSAGGHIVNSAETPTGRQVHAPAESAPPASAEPASIEPTQAADGSEPAPVSEPSEAPQTVETSESTGGGPVVNDSSEQDSVEPAPATETVTQGDPDSAPQAAGPKPSLATRILQRLPGSHTATAPTS